MASEGVKGVKEDKGAGVGEEERLQEVMWLEVKMKDEEFQGAIQQMPMKTTDFGSVDS